MVEMLIAHVAQDTVLEYAGGHVDRNRINSLLDSNNMMPLQFLDLGARFCYPTGRVPRVPVETIFGYRHPIKLVSFMCGSVASALCKRPALFWAGIGCLQAMGITGNQLVSFMCGSVASALCKRPALFWAGIGRLQAMGITGNHTQVGAMVLGLQDSQWALACTTMG